MKIINFPYGVTKEIESLLTENDIVATCIEGYICSISNEDWWKLKEVAEYAIDNGDIRLATSYEIRDAICNIEGLKADECTCGINGYPSGCYGIVAGLDNIEQAQKIANRYGLDVIQVRKRDGWSFYEKRGIAYEELATLPEDYHWMQCRTIEEAVEYVNGAFDGLDEEDDAELIADIKALRDKCERTHLDDGEVIQFSVVTGEVRTNKEYAMRIHDEDVWTYEIVIDCNQY